MLDSPDRPDSQGSRGIALISEYGITAAGRAREKGIRKTEYTIQL